MLPLFCDLGSGREGLSGSPFPAPGAPAHPCSMWSTCRKPGDTWPQVVPLNSIHGSAGKATFIQATQVLLGGQVG